MYFYTIINPSNSDNTSGGPQAANSIINNIKKCGYSVEIVTPNTNFKDPDSSLFNVYHDMFNDPSGSPWFSQDNMNAMLNSPTPFLFSECAYTACNTAPYGDLKKGGTDLTPISRKFMTKAARFIVASPMHGEQIRVLSGVDLQNIYPYLVEVDSKKFFDTNQERDIEYITVGAMNWWKGTDRIIDDYGSKGLKVIGYGDQFPNNTEAEFLGKIPNSEMPRFYNRSKSFVHTPRWKESFSITTAEAFLCGCRVIVNENVGAMSFNKDLSNPDTYTESVEKLQEMIIGEFGHGTNNA